MGRSVLTCLSATAILLFVCACGSPDGSSHSAVAISTPPPTDTALPTPEPTLTPSPVPTPDPLGCADRITLASQMAADVEEALRGYEAGWGFAFIDVSCNNVTALNPDYSQYAASSGKIISMIAALRAVERGDVPLEAIEDDLTLITTLSLDSASDDIETYLQPGDLNAVLEDAGTVSARIDGTWHQTNFSATDMARIWAALVEGRLLGPDMTAYLLELVQHPDIPNGFDTFPGKQFKLQDFEWGQKAGYYVSDGVPYFFVGAGYLHYLPTDDYFIPVLIIKTEIEDLLDPQRYTVFPIVVDYVERMVEAQSSATESSVEPTSVSSGP